MLSSGFLSKIRERVGRLEPDILRDLVLKFAEEREFFQIILDSMTEGVLVTDEKEVVQYANRTACRLLDRQARSLVGRPVLEGIDSVDFYNLVERSFRQWSRIRNKEVSLYYPADRILNVNIFPLVTRRMTHGKAVIFMDITHEKQEEQRLRRAESMAALSTITAGIAHEIKNPLGALDIHLQLLEGLAEGASPVDRGRMQRYLEIVREEVGRLNGIVVDFLDAVRPLQVSVQKTSVTELVKGVAELYGPEFDSRGIHLELDLEEGPLEAAVDPRLLRQAIGNLLKNGSEAIIGSGVVRIATRTEEEYLLVLIEDSGCGMEKEQLGRIFEPYHTTKASGTGLGLTIVYRIIKEHGGTIHVESRPGAGTKFIIKLPLWGRARRMLE